MLKNEKGFVLLELLFILLIMLPLIGMSITTYNGISKRQLYNTARDIQTSIRIAQDRANGEGNTHRINFYPSSSRCVHVRNAYILKEINIPRSIKLYPTSFPDNKLKFSGKIRPSSGGTITLSSRKNQLKITVLPVTGRVKIYPITEKED